MEPLPALSGITRPTTVGDRSGGGRRQADAFRRALEQESGEAAEPDESPARDAPVRPGLQRRPPGGRKEPQANARHVDVIA